MEKKSRFKKLLTTASALAVIAGASTSAMGALIHTDGAGPATVTNVGGVNISANFTNGDNFYFAHAVALATAGAVTIDSIDMNNIAGGPFTAAHATTLGSVADVAGTVAGTAKKLAVTVNDGIVLTLDGAGGVAADGVTPIVINTYTGLGDITLGSAGAGTAALTFAAAETVNGKIDGDADNKGIINTGGNAVVFGGKIGNTHAVDKINVANGGSATFKKDVKVNDAGGSGILLADTGKIIIDNNAPNTTVTVTAPINATVNNNGSIEIAANTNAVFSKAIGGAARLNKISIAADSSAKFEGNVNLQYNGGNGIIFAAQTSKAIIANNVTLAGDAVSNGAAGNGQIEFEGIATVTGDIGNAAAIKSIKLGAGAVAFNHANAVKAQTFTVSEENAIGNFAHGLEGNVVIGNNGIINVAAGNVVGDLTVEDEGKFTGAATDITGDVVIDTTNDQNTMRQVTGTVTVHKGKLAIANIDGVHLATVDGGELTATGNLGGALSVTADGKFTGAATDVAGAVVFNTSTEGNVIQDAAAAITLTSGKLTMRNATGNAALVKVEGGELTMVNADHDVQVTGGKIAAIGTVANDLTVSGGEVVGVGAVTHNVAVSGSGKVSSNGVVTGTLDVTGHGSFVGDANSTITGNVTIETEVADPMNVIHDANTVLLTNGRLTMHDSLGLHDVTVDAGELTMNVAGQDLLVNGGTAKFNTVTRDLNIDANGIVTAAANAGTVGRNLMVAGKGLFVGNAGSNIAENVTINTTNTDWNILNDTGNGDATKTVQLLKGKLKMNDSAGDVTVTAGNSSLEIATVGQDLILIGNGAADVKVTAVTRNTIIDDDAILVIDSDFRSGDIKAANDGKGIVAFNNDVAITVTSKFNDAGDKGLRVIEFAGSDVKFANGNAMKHKGIFGFSGDAPKTITFNDQTNVGSASKFMNFSANDVTIVLQKPDAGGNAGTLIESEITVADNGTKKVNFQLDNLFNATLVEGAKADAANFTTGTADKGILTFGAATAVTVNSVGAGGSPALEKIIFTESGRIINDAHAKEISVAAGKVATLGGNVKTTDGLTLAGVGSKVIFSDDAIVATEVLAGSNGNGVIEYAGDVTVSENIGTSVANLGRVIFSDTEEKIAKVNVDEIHSKLVQFRKGAVQLKKDLVISGGASSVVNFHDSDIDLADKTMTIATGETLNISGDNLLSFTATLRNGDASTGGKIVIASGATYSVDGDATLLIDPSVVYEGARLKKGETVIYSLVDVNGAAITSGIDFKDVALVEKNTNIKLNLSRDAKGSVILVGRDGVEESIVETLKKTALTNDPAYIANIDALVNALDGTEADKTGKVIKNLVNADGSRNDEKTAEAVLRIFNPVADAVNEAVEGVAGAASSAVVTHMVTLANNTATEKNVASVETSGVAAGDDKHRYGVWAAPFYNNTTQKARKGAAGYKSEGMGASFGFDTRANDDMIIGTALTFASSDVKHKDFKSGDKTKINSYMFSIYGMQQITDNWYLNAVATFGTNEVKNSSRRVTSLTGYETVNSKYTANAFNAEAIFGYNYMIDQVALTPMIGARFSRVNDGGYKETGSTTGQNLTITTKAASKFEVVAGARVSGYAFETNGVVLHPEVHGFINQDLIGKNPIARMEQDGAPSGLATKTRKPVRTSYNVGLSINSEYHMMEYGIGYDADLANKRIGHQGTLKVRVNF